MVKITPSGDWLVLYVNRQEVCESHEVKIIWEGLGLS